MTLMMQAKNRIR